MFGFEKPRWHYIRNSALSWMLWPSGADPAGSPVPVPERRPPPGGRLMVRYDAADADELRWAKVESWEDAGHAVIRDTGRELAPGVRPAPW